MPTINDIIKAKNNNLETVPNLFAGMVKDTQMKSWEKIVTIIQKIERKGENIVMNKRNLALIDEIMVEMKNITLKDGYLKSVIEFAKKIDAQKAVNKSYFSKAFSTTIGETGLADTLFERSKRNGITALIEAVDSQFLAPAKSVLEGSVSTGASWSSTVEELKRIVVGDEEIEGKLYRYAKQTASDAFSITDRTYTNAIAEDLDLEFFLYAGDTIQTTRPFCDERVGKYFHYKEIEEFANEDWAGKIDATNAETIFIYAGGWNCKHSWLPVSAIVVPKDVIERNIFNGNYQPSETERELLNV
jgi:hypothetical protein